MLLIPLWPSVNTDPLSNFDLSAEAADYASFEGSPNRLSSSTIEYKSIEDVYAAGCLSQTDYLQRLTVRREMQPRGAVISENPEKTALHSLTFQGKKQKPALEIIRKRRSAVDMDGKLRSSLARLGRIVMDSTRGFSSSYLAPLALAPDQTWRPYFIHPILYVHQIDGLAPGAYLFDRNTFELSMLSAANVRTHAKFVSCLQDIASDGIFAASLIADFREAFAMFGERAYRYVHQEAGFIGQLFYLTALALDIDATGIGCFIDDEINQSIPEGMQVVYNFTFGRAVLDPRLTALPGYDFEAG
jgi:SagB-type dehydrogenase family enzyme